MSHGGWLAAILNLLGMGGSPVVEEAGGGLCGTPGLAPRLSGTPALAPRLTAAPGLAPALTGTPAVEAC